MIRTKLLDEIWLGNKVRYVTSDKGKQYLRLYREMTVLLGTDENDEQTALKRIQVLPDRSARCFMR
jgi:hypothetical protein